MKVRIVRPHEMGFSSLHAGKEYEAVRIDRGYKLTDRIVSGAHVDDRWIKQGHAETVEEIDYSGMSWAPWVAP